MAKQYNPYKCKIHRSYTVVEIAELYGVHKRTVRNWIVKGLHTYNEKRPLLIHGAELRLFINNQRKGYKYKCKLSEVYCFKCRTPRKPQIQTINFIEQSSGIGRLFARCSVCDLKVNKYFNLRQFNAIKQELGVENTARIKTHNYDGDTPPTFHLNESA
jgi:hypothetical protein